MAKRLYLVRHGSLQLPAANVYVGSSDLSLNEEGIEEVKRLGKTLENISWDGVFHSPMKRTVETKNILLDKGVKKQVLPDLREIDFGDWELKTFETIAKESPELVDQWADYNDTFRFPNGESHQEFQHRVIRVANKLIEEKGDRFLIITHGGMIRNLICFFLGYPFEDYLKFAVDTASLTTIDLFGEKGVLKQLNLKP